MTEYLAIENKKLDISVYETEREEVLQTWHTGRGVDFRKGLLRHRNMADTKKFSVALANAETQGQTILQLRKFNRCSVVEGGAPGRHGGHSKPQGRRSSFSMTDALQTAVLAMGTEAVSTSWPS